MPPLAAPRGLVRAASGPSPRFVRAVDGEAKPARFPAFVRISRLLCAVARLLAPVPPSAIATGEEEGEILEYPPTKIVQSVNVPEPFEEVTLTVRTFPLIEAISPSICILRGSEVRARRTG